MRTFEIFQELWTYIGDKPDEEHVLTFGGDPERRNRIVYSYLVTTRTRGENNLQGLPADTPIYRGPILLHSHLNPCNFQRRPIDSRNSCGVSPNHEFLSNHYFSL
jgi:hypothetical protein